jgi:hypothetical protein
MVDSRVGVLEFDKEVKRDTSWVCRYRKFILYAFSYDSEDISQDFWMKAMMACNNYNVTSKAKRSTLVTKYILQDVRNKEHMCNHKKRKFQPKPVGLLLDYPSMNVESDIFAWDLLDSIRSKINDLQKSVLSLMLESHGPKYISRKLSIDIGMVKRAIGFIQDVTRSLVTT